MDAIKGIPTYPGQFTGVNPEKVVKSEFPEILKQFVGHVEEEIQKADNVAKEFAVGERYGLHEVMIAAEEADLSFRFLLQIRNKLLEAYQEIMRMQF
jgi:flagellar hook-basal body complex protein FliE